MIRKILADLKEMLPELKEILDTLPITAEAEEFNVQTGVVKKPKIRIGN